VRDAVRHFKRAHGLAANGVAGREALQLLGIHRPSCRISTRLAVGDHGPKVRCLRRFLVGRGFEMRLVGGYNGRVARAVRAVEARRRLAVDGVADRRVLRALGAWPTTA
jgi:peptidoglycan hydrolase-like protein with peptidoglycan-binding domain